MTPDDDARAAEYVLGTLDARERAAVERALYADPAWQAAVYAWQDRLLGLAARAEPVEPRAGAWAPVEARLAPPAAANDPAWQRVRRWQWASAAGLAASLVLAALLVVSPARAPSVRHLAVLQAPRGKSDGWVVEATAGGAVRLVPIGATAPVPAGKTLQFWTKAEGAPRADLARAGARRPGCRTAGLAAAGAWRAAVVRTHPRARSRFADRPTHRAGALCRPLGAVVGARR